MAKCALCGKAVSDRGALRTSDGKVVCMNCLAKKNFAQGHGVSGTVAVAKIVRTMTFEDVKDYQYYDDRTLAAMKRDSIVVSTASIPQAHEVIGPVFFQLSNKGLFSSTYSQLAQKHKNEIIEKRRNGEFSPKKTDWGYFWGGFYAMDAGQNFFDEAFYIATQEIRYRAALMGGDAVIGMRMDIDLDTNGFQFFYLQMYGTVVRYSSEVVEL